MLGVSVSVNVGVGPGVGVSEGVGVRLKVGVGDGVKGVQVAVGTSVLLGDGVILGVKLGVAVTGGGSSPALTIRRGWTSPFSQFMEANAYCTETLPLPLSTRPWLLLGLATQPRTMSLMSRLNQAFWAAARADAPASGSRSVPSPLQPLCDQLVSLSALSQVAELLFQGRRTL